MKKLNQIGYYAVYKGLTYRLGNTISSSICEIWGNGISITVNIPELDSAYRLSTRAEYEGLSLTIGGSKENGFYLLGNGDPEFDKKHGMHYKGTDRFFVLDKEIDSIWEERTPIEGFPFKTEKIVYLKMHGKWLD